jgi:predicted TIM-barrel fold metal-dependent hydrolase
VRGRWRRDETGELPIPLEPASSDEYHPLPLSPLVRETRRRAWQDAADNARRVGLSRRDFLRTSRGAATVLLALGACSKDESAGRSGGTFTVPTDAGVDRDTADAALAGSDVPVIDAQAHLLEYDLSKPPPPSWFGSGFPQAGCGAADPRDCFGVEHFVDAVFAKSETAAAVLSAVPAPDAFTGELSVEIMDQARRRVGELVGGGRLFLHGLVAPTSKPLAAALDDMEVVAQKFNVHGWKAYTGTGPGWRLDDSVGRATVQKAVDLGIPRIAVHKGISGRAEFASPADIGPVATQFPAVQFAVYHSGWEPGVTEGPFTEQTSGKGSNRLVASLRRAGVRPNANVYAELGSTWFNLMRSPTEAAHLLGKLLVAVGEDRVIWGTDSIWYGSPQGQIDAFRSFAIAPELQDRFGYPALTDEIKAKILGRNIAHLYGLDLATIGKRPRPS